MRGIPVTSVGRTLLDLAGLRDTATLVPLVERAVLGDLVTQEQLWTLLERHRGRRGRRRLADTLRDTASSALERRVDAILRGSRLPPFVREHPVGPYRLDFAWPSAKVAIEADGRRWHSAPAHFARDRAKHNLLVAEGWRVLRVTPRDLADPAALVEAVERLLAGGR